MKKEIRELQEYFLKRPEVSAAFLFGSMGKGRGGKISDWDIAVYFRPQDRLEWEETQRQYPQEDKIWDDLVDILKTDDVDLIVLNRAAASVAASALCGKPLVIKDRRLFLDFMIRVTRQAEDYREFVDSYYEISQRSISLAPEDKERLEKIIDFLEQEITACDYFAGFSFTDYRDAHKRRDVERWVENMINSSIDIGKIILASQKKRIPDYYKDVFVELGLLKEFKPMEVEKFTGWIKLRNILAHEYLDIKWRRIENFIKENKHHFRLFLENAKKFLKRSNR